MASATTRCHCNYNDFHVHFYGIMLENNIQSEALSDTKPTATV